LRSRWHRRVVSGWARRRGVIAPLRHEVGERKGPIAQQWEGEVVSDENVVRQ
jgi:hypothetical protein